MKWNIHQLRPGEEQVVLQFAWMPTRIDQETVVWWEFYIETRKRAYCFGRGHYWRILDRKLIHQKALDTPKQER